MTRGTHPLLLRKLRHFPFDDGKHQGTSFAKMPLGLLGQATSHASLTAHGNGEGCVECCKGRGEDGLLALLCYDAVPLAIADETLRCFSRSLLRR